MKLRDKRIIDDLQRFRTLDRDDIAQIHFNNVKNPKTAANFVLKRLRRDGYIECDTNSSPYRYFPSPSSIKKDSTKIPHYEAISEVYIQLIKSADIKLFEAEPKYGSKGTVEPDIFTIINNSPFFIEVQRSTSFSDKNMSEKIKRYIDFYHSNIWKQFTWQNKNKPVFPIVLILCKRKYQLPQVDFNTLQFTSVGEFLKATRPRPKRIEVSLNGKSTTVR